MYGIPEEMPTYNDILVSRIYLRTVLDENITTASRDTAIKAACYRFAACPKMLRLGKGYLHATESRNVLILIIVVC